MLKARDLLASPAFIVMKAADEFSDKTTLSDNGSSYISDDLAKWLERHDMAHVPAG